MVQVLINGVLTNIEPSQLGKDSRPLIDENTRAVLDGVTRFKIRQRVRFWEAITGGCIEQPNVFDIYDLATNQQIMVATEHTNNCNRICCSPHHSFFINFRLTGGVDHSVSNSQTLHQLPTAMTMEREGCCSKMWLGCPICHERCADGMHLHAGEVALTPEQQPGKVLFKGDKVGKKSCLCIGPPQTNPLAG